MSGCVYTHTGWLSQSEKLLVELEEKAESEQKEIREELGDLDALLPDLEAKVNRKPATTLNIYHYKTALL